MTTDRDDLRDRLDAIESSLSSAQSVVEAPRTKHGVTADFIKFDDADRETAEFDTHNADETGHGTPDHD